MRILFISDNKINGFGGGCIENKKHYSALKNICGTFDSLKVISTDADFEDALEITLYKNKYLDIIVRLMGHSSFLYFTMLLNKKKIIEYAPEVVFLGRSRFGFFAKWVKKNLLNCKVISNVDNVEYDYVDAYFAEDIGLSTRIKKWLERIVVKRDEKLTIKYSDKLIFLTMRNVNRYKELYGYEIDQPTIIPICLKDEINLKINTLKKNVVFLGSLDYKPNVIAVYKLLNEIWLKNFVYRNDVHLIIAGRNPNAKLVEYVSRFNNVSIIKNFKSAEEIIPRGSLMVAPIENGAGMKVKVAETLSMGLSIVGSDEALVGYEKAIENDCLQSITRAKTSDEYKEAIIKYLTEDDCIVEAIEKQNKDIYKNYYSYFVSEKEIASVINTINQFDS